MSATTIKIPDTQIGAIRESLRARRDDLMGDASADRARRAEVESLLRQIDSGSASSCYEITGSATCLWCAVYDALCGAAERLAVDCNELWRGATDVADARAEVAALGDWLDLLETLGASPVGATGV